jgi:hypothetical protein
MKPKKTTHLTLAGRLSFLWLLLGIILLSGCARTGDAGRDRDVPAGTSGQAGGQPLVHLEKDTHHFGTVFSGEKVLYRFRLTNTGDAPLVLSGTRSSCGCTVGDYTREPIAPGEQGHVSVQFNSAGRMGFQSETLYVLTNAEPSEYRLRITAEVIRN